MPHDDLDNLFDREEAKRLREERAAARQFAIDRAAEFEREDAALAARAREATLDTNRRLILAEYARHGLDPPSAYLVSLPMLLKLGWRIEEIDGKKTLIAPPAAKAWQGFRDGHRGAPR